MNFQNPHCTRAKLLLAALITVGFSVQGSVPAIAETTIAQIKPSLGTVKPAPIGVPRPLPSGVSTCCPPMNAQVFGTFFKSINPGNITSPYGLKFDPVGLGLGTQYTAMLNAYQSYYSLLNYSSSGQITNLTIGVYLVDGGNNNTPVATGTPIEQAFITFSNGPIIQPAANAFFNAALQPNKWYGIQEYSYTNVSFKTNPQQAGFEESCNKQIQTWVRWQVINGRIMRQTITDGKLESVEVKQAEKR